MINIEIDQEIIGVVQDTLSNEVTSMREVLRDQVNEPNMSMTKVTDTVDKINAISVIVDQIEVKKNFSTQLAQ